MPTRALQVQRGFHASVSEMHVCVAGEKLSKQQLQHSNIIKKLRVKEKDCDGRIIKQSKKLKEQEEELKHLQQVGDVVHLVI